MAISEEKKWILRSSKYLLRTPWLNVRKDAVFTSKNVEIDDFYILEYPDWVNVIAITDKGKYIIERQYRHGLQKTVYEICAGICEPNEEPLDAAKRELLEETGYAGGKWTFLGKYAPNPSAMTNWSFTYLAEDVTRSVAPTQEPTEDIDVTEVSRDELLLLMGTGQIVEGVMLAPLWKHLYMNK